MKRSAQTQLTKNDADDDDEIEEVEQSEGFRKANESVLMSRPMRGLPKRGGASAPSVPSFAPAGSKLDTPVSDFKGFGSSTPSISPFTFSAGTPASNASRTGASSSPFKITIPPTVSASASPATKEFASYIHSSLHTNGKLSNASTTAPGMPADEDAVSYFSSLLGLNECFQAAVQKQLAESRFADISVLFDHYTNFRTTIQREFDSKQNTAAGPSINGVSSSTGFTAGGAASAPKLPVPPTSFKGFGGSAFPLASSNSPSTTSAGGFKPIISTTSTGTSSFSAGTSSTGNAPSNPFSFQSTTSSATTKPFTFGGFDTTSSTSAKPHTFGASEKSNTETTSASKQFTFGATDSTAKVPSSTSSSTASTPSPFTMPSTATVDKQPTPSFGTPFSGFGGGEGSSGFGSAMTASSTSGSGGLFGKAAPLFGGASAGFTFNAPKATFASPFSKPASPAQSDKPEDGSVEHDEDAGSGAADSRGDTPASVSGGDVAGDGSTPKVLGENPNDLEGEGEENEETVHSCRASVYRFGEQQGAKQWIGRGVGFIRLKKHKTDGSRRLLSRNSATGKIMMNFKLYHGLTTKRDKNSLSVTGHEDGKEANFRIRVKDEAILVALQEAINQAVSEL